MKRRRDNTNMAQELVPQDNQIEMSQLHDGRFSSVQPQKKEDRQENGASRHAR